MLSGCGDILSKHRQSIPTGHISTIVEESSLVVQALTLNTLSKLTFADSQRFNSLIRDIFPNIDINNVLFEHLVEPMKQSAVEMQLTPSDIQVYDR